MAPTYGKICVPLLYALCSHKDEQMYTLMFNVVLTTFDDANLQARVTRITLDFELAASNALKNTFPAVTIVYCFFHFGQSMFRQLQKAGIGLALSGKIKENVTQKAESRQ